MTLAVFVADGGPARGAGHIARCGALAHELRREGWQCELATNAGALETMPEFETMFDRVLSRPPGPPTAGFLSSMWGSGCDALVTDHYDIDARLEAHCRSWARQVIAIDDLANRAHDCDVLVDVTPSRSTSRYDTLVPDACRRLIGSEYALLAREFAQLRYRVLPREPGPARRLLISLGATDPANLTPVAIAAVSLAELDLEVDVLLSPAAPHLKEVHRAAVQTGARVQWTKDIAALVSRADIAVGAAGGSALQRCCLGVPSVLLVGAANQHDYAVALSKAGAARLVREPVTPGAIAAALREIADDASLQDVMRRHASRICDGLGARRVAQAMMPSPRVRSGATVSLRPVRQDDAAMLFAWQIESHTRRYARSRETPTKSEHYAWIERKLADPRCIMSIVLHMGEPAGVIRLDRVPGDNAFEVSINIAARYLRLGLGRAALSLAAFLVPDAALRAYVIDRNDASRALFVAAGYSMEGGGWFVLTPRTAAGACGRTVSQSL
jgi:UDP-2,4-diacetamido-2,4,6-trideoxy-beta-L-altropyranose hydrolase